jgi:hypothetical protein
VDVMAQDYYTSEQFIHEELLRMAAKGVEGIYDIWKTDGKINSFIIGWPAELIHDSTGVSVEGPCVKELHADKSNWSRELTEFASRIKAYALMLAEKRPKEILIIFESHHGTRSWNIPIHRSGDRDVLGRKRVEDNKHSIGLLWSSKRGTS